MLYQLLPIAIFAIAAMLGFVLSTLRNSEEERK
jgi:hypothetical protein